MDSWEPAVDAVPVVEDEDDEEPEESVSFLLFPEHMVHRRLVGGRWITCASTEQGHELDSRVHMYDRTVGFLRADVDQEMIDGNEDVSAAFERRRTDPAKAKAHKQVVERWATFERWVLARMPDSAYATFLRSCAAADDRTERLAFIAPPVALVVTYQDYLRKDSHETHKAGQHVMSYKHVHLRFILI